MTAESAAAADTPMSVCTVKLGNSAHPMVANLAAMLGGSGQLSPAGVMTYRSAPVVAESSLYYADV
jgi:hypothetical protein